MEFLRSNAVLAAALEDAFWVGSTAFSHVPRAEEQTLPMTFHGCGQAATHVGQLPPSARGWGEGNAAEAEPVLGASGTWALTKRKQEPCHRTGCS